MEKVFDLIVIGAGTGGYTAAIRAAQEGLTVALVEEGDIGGTCLNRGCIPTKTLMHASHFYRKLAEAGDLGVNIDGASFDLSKMYARKDEVVAQIRGGIEQLILANKVALLKGHACITAPGAVTVDGESYKSKNILIATGSEPAIPIIPGADLPGVLTSNELLSWDRELPKSLTIIGGGVIGVEIASIFGALGAQVTIVEAQGRILPTMDREISQNLSMILKKRGIAIHSDAKVEKIGAKGSALTTAFSAAGKSAEVESELLLIAAGRRANTAGLFAPGFSVAENRGIVVDENFQTGAAGVYAVGDVVSGGIQLAHVAAAQAGCAVAHMAGKKSEINLEVVPACVYTDPEIACVGLTEAEAKERGLEVRTGKYPMSGNGRTIIDKQERGFIKLVFEAQSEVLVGAQLMCARATDMISELGTAIANHLTVHQLAGEIRPHPSFAEGVTEAAESVLDTAIHLAPKQKRK